MMEQIARALVEVAQTKHEIPVVMRDLLRVHEAMAIVPHSLSDLQEMAVPLEQRQTALQQALTRRVHPFVLHTLLILQRERLLIKLEAFVQLALRLAAQQAKHHIIYITTTRALVEKDRDALVRVLRKVLGGTHELYERVDARILGGLILETNDQRFDASTRGKLEQLKASLYAAA